VAINRWHQSDIKVGEFWREISEHIVYVTWDITTAMKLLPDQGVKNERNLIEVRMVFEYPVSCLKGPSHW